MNTTTLDRTPVPWTPSLGLDMPVMDTTHESCVALLADVVQAADATLLSR
jgi:hypothetical protein